MKEYDVVQIQQGHIKARLDRHMSAVGPFLGTCKVDHLGLQCTLDYVLKVGERSVPGFLFGSEATLSKNSFINGMFSSINEFIQTMCGSGRQKALSGKIAVRQKKEAVPFTPNSMLLDKF